MNIILFFSFQMPLEKRNYFLCLTQVFKIGLFICIFFPSDSISNYENETKCVGVPNLHFFVPVWNYVYADFTTSALRTCTCFFVLFHWLNILSKIIFTLVHFFHEIWTMNKKVWTVERRDKAKNTAFSYEELGGLLKSVRRKIPVDPSPFFHQQRWL